MNTKTIIPLLFLTASLLIGCSSGDATTTNQDSGATGQASVASTEKAKCGGCGKEVVVAELVDHDGAKMCKECVAAHNH